MKIFVLGCFITTIFGWGLVMAFDAGRKDVVLKCRTFHAFTYAKTAWQCIPLRTAEDAEQQQSSMNIALET